MALRVPICVGAESELRSQDVGERGDRVVDVVVPEHRDAGEHEHGPTSGRRRQGFFGERPVAHRGHLKISPVRQSHSVERCVGLRPRNWQWGYFSSRWARKNIPVPISRENIPDPIFVESNTLEGTSEQN